MVPFSPSLSMSILPDRRLIWNAIKTGGLPAAGVTMAKRVICVNKAPVRFETALVIGRFKRPD
jgi:hypothetical protein